MSASKIVKPCRKEEARIEKYKTKKAAARLIHHWRIDRRTGVLIDEGPIAGATPQATPTATLGAFHPPAPIEPSVAIHPPSISLSPHDLLFSILSRSAPALLSSSLQSQIPVRPIPTFPTSSANKASILHLIHSE